MQAIVMMGVCGSGKTTIGREIEKRLGYEFVDGDDLHTPETKLRLSQGVALSDQDRLPWLRKCKQTIDDRINQNKGIVLACSCLKKIYRDIFRENLSQKLVFIYLSGSKELISERVSRRVGHFVTSNLVESQFATLEIPQNESDIITVDISREKEIIVEEIFSKLNSLI